MLLLAQDPWSQSEVRKLIALIATEHLRAQAAFDALPVAVGVVATDLRVIWANQGFRALLPVIEDAAPGVRDAVESAARTGVATQLTVGARQVRLDVCPSRLLPGEVVLISKEDRPRPEDSFAELEHCEVPVFVYRREDGRLIFANSQAAELTGYPPEALLKLHIADLSPESHQLLTSAGDCTVTLRSVTGLSPPLKCRVRVIDEVGVCCLTVLAKEQELETYARNLATIEGCLTGAFPDSTISRAASVEPHGQRFRIFTERHERVLTVTDDALRSPQFRSHLREVPEALNITRSVMLTQDGVNVD